MEVEEAIRKAEAHLKNALELVPRPVGKEELLYMWDNQITALDTFLADTEVLKHPLLDRARQSMRDAKKKLQTSVMKFEAQMEGEEFVEVEEDEAEAAASYVEMAYEMLELAKEALDQKVKDVKELPVWEEPLAIINGYLADSEPYQQVDKDLRRARSVVRAARRDLKSRIDDVFLAWREKDMKSGNDD